YAIATQNLFEIDVMLRRATTYALVVVLIAVLYVSALCTIGVVMPEKHLLGDSPTTLALLNVVLLFLIAPLQARVQATVDRVFFRKGYDAEMALSDLGQRLVTAHTLERVQACTRDVLAETIIPSTYTMFRWRAGGQLEPFPGMNGSFLV